MAVFCRSAAFAVSDAGQLGCPSASRQGFRSPRYEHIWGGAVSQTQGHFWGLVISVHLGLALHTPAVGAFAVRVPVRVAPSPFIRRSFGAQDEPVLSNCRSAEPSVTRAETRAPPHAGPGRTGARGPAAEVRAASSVAVSPRSFTPVSSGSESVGRRRDGPPVRERGGGHVSRWCVAA